MTKIIAVELDPEIQKSRDEDIANQFQREIDFVKAQRRSAYSNESDPIFFQWQRGETYTEKDWKDKVDEINSRFPLPEEPS